MNGVFVLVHGIKYTPLGISIVFNHEMIAHKLLDHPEIDVNKKTCESTALHYACLRNSVSLIEAICTKVSLKLLEKGSKQSKKIKWNFPHSRGYQQWSFSTSTSIFILLLCLKWPKNQF